MNTKTIDGLMTQKLVRAVAILSLLVLMVVILVYAKAFLIPLTLAAILSMLLLPIAKWLQGKGVNRGIAIIISLLVLIAFFVLVFMFIGWQMADLASNAKSIQQQFVSQYHQMLQALAKSMSVPPEKLQQMIQQQQQSSQGSAGAFLTGFLSGLGGLLTDTLLVLVYIFLMMFYRGRLRTFILKMIPEREQENANETINTAQQVVQKYLTGMFWMIVCLWIMYSIGFTIAGVKHAFFFAILCGLLEIIPFIGNITGTALTILMSLAQGGNINIVVGILISYALVQFIQSYVLEPLVVGAEVNINPLFTIIGLVAGEALWGIPGMILAIPLLGITKIVCDHVEPLKPYGFLIGQEKKKDSGLKKKVKDLFKKK